MLYLFACCLMKIFYEAADLTPTLLHLDLHPTFIFLCIQTFHFSP